MYSSRDPDWLETLAIEALNEHTLAGLAVGVVRGGGLDRVVGLGLADASARRPVDGGTVFRIGSISKTMTAIAVMQLVEERRLALDDPVGEHLRSSRVQSPPGAPPVTVRHLLTHSAGIGEIRSWRDVTRPMIGLASKAGEPAPELADYYRGGVRAEVAPGTKWAYANHGFALLGLLVQDLRGAPFAEVMRERVFDPLGMDHTDFVRSDRVSDRLAVGYGLRARGRMKPVKDHEIAVGPAGSCYSCTEDMGRYVAALLDRGAPLLRTETFELMLAPQGVRGEHLPGMGLSFFVERMGGRRVAGHDGGWPGFISSMLVAPDDGVGVVAFTNTNTEAAPHLLAERVLRRRLDAPAPADPVVPEDPHLWRELAGIYRPAPGLKTNLRVWPLIGGEAEVLVRKGHLTVRAQSPLRPLRRGVRLRAADRDDPLAFEARHNDVRVAVAFERDDARPGGVAAGRLDVGRVHAPAPPAARDQRAAVVAGGGHGDGRRRGGRGGAPPAPAGPRVNQARLSGFEGSTDTATPAAVARNPAFREAGQLLLSRANGQSGTARVGEAVFSHASAIARSAPTGGRRWGAIPESSARPAAQVGIPSDEPFEESSMLKSRRLAAVALAAGALATVPACSEDVESGADKVKQDGEDVGGKAEDAAKEAGGKAEDLARDGRGKAEDAAREARKAAGDATDSK